MTEHPENEANIFNATFLGVAVNWYNWNLQFAKAQLNLWLSGCRNSNIHDATFTCAEVAQKVENLYV